MQKRHVQKRNTLARLTAGTVASVGTTLALAAPDGAKIAEEIGKSNSVIDSAGGAMITVFIGIMVFAVIIGMIMRKGK